MPCNYYKTHQNVALEKTLAVTNGFSFLIEAFSVRFILVYQLSCVSSKHVCVYKAEGYYLWFN